ncbi:peptidase inhibitor family I36 protein [Streptomyces phaeochromogenes]|uniref:peptidase inhibitor family I36 protein n=1 Tax=Streptomyces phaeochromogenes TaxID=1923 RepID=UPI00340DB7E4
MRKRAAFGAVAAAAFTAVLATAPSASAEANPPGCGKEYFCAYSGENQTGQLVLKTKGNWSGNVAIRSVFNNGVAFPGADHVDVTYTSPGGGGETACLHYNPGPGAYKVNAVAGVHITKVVWRGEC